MTLLQMVIARCPECGQLHRDIGVVSFSMFGGTQYTDGYASAELPDMEPLLRCIGCKKYFLRHENQIFEFDEMDDLLAEYRKEHPQLMDAEDLPEVVLADEISDYTSFLAANKLEICDEIGIRLQLLWKFNDPKRVYLEEKNGRYVAPRHIRMKFAGMKNTLESLLGNKDYRDNLERLYNLTREGEYPGQYFMLRVDILRISGQFKKARKYLEENRELSGDCLPEMVQLQKQLISQRKRGVYGIFI